MKTINENHLKNLENLDLILSRIYSNGKNKATQVEIFKSETKLNGVIETVSVYFMNSSDPQIEALNYLEKEGFLFYNKVEEAFCLTFKGILKLYNNSFSSEYLSAVSRDNLITKDLKSKYYYNILAIILSFLALIITILKSVKC